MRPRRGWTACGLLLLLGPGPWACARSGYERSPCPSDTVPPADASSADRSGTDGGTAPGLISDPGAVVSLGAERATNSYALAFDGTRYGVAWVEVPKGSYDRRLVFATAAPDGRRLGAPLLIRAVPEDVQAVQVLATGDTFTVFHLSWNGAELRVTIVDPDQSVPILRDAVVTTWIDDPDVFATPQGFGLLYAKNGNCGQGGHVHAWVQRLDPEGTAIGTPAVLECAAQAQYEPSGAWVGDGALVAWVDGTDPWQIRVGRQDANLTPGSHAILSPSTKYQDHPTVTTDGVGRALVTWEENDQAFQLAVDAPGTPRWPAAAVLVPSNRLESMNYAVAGGDGRAGVVWQSDTETVLTQLRFAGIDLGASVGAVATGAQLTGPAGEHLCPQIARGPNAFATIFRSDLAGERGLRMKIVED